MPKHTQGRVKILHLIGELRLGGSERQLTLTLSHLDRERFDSSVVVFNPCEVGILSCELEKAGVDVIPIPPSTKGILPRMDFLNRLFRRESPDIVHSWTFHDNPYAGIVGRLSGVPVRWGSARGSIHSPDLKSLPGHLRWLSLRSTSKIVVNAISIANELRLAGVSAERIIHLPNCVKTDLETHPPKLSEYGIEARHQLIGTVGNLRPVKNHPMFIQGIAPLLEQFPDVCAVIVGQSDSSHDGYADELRVLIHELDLQGKVILTGFRDDVPSLMRRLEIFCLTSHSEGAPNAILEAMSAGRPVVATRVGDVSDLVQEGISGYLVASGDVRGFRRAVEKLLSNPSLADSMGRAGLEIVQRRFAPQRTSSILERFYLEALSEHTGNRMF